MTKTIGGGSILNATKNPAKPAQRKHSRNGLCIWKKDEIGWHLRAIFCACDRALHVPSNN